MGQPKEIKVGETANTLSLKLKDKSKIKKQQ